MIIKGDEMDVLEGHKNVEIQYFGCTEMLRNIPTEGLSKHTNHQPINRQQWKMRNALGMKIYKGLLRGGINKCSSCISSSTHVPHPVLHRKPPYSSCMIGNNHTQRKEVKKVQS